MLLVFPLLKPPSWNSDFRSHPTILYMASLYSWTKKIWIEPLKLCSYLAYKLSYWFFKVFQKITAICSRHLGFLSDNINAVILPLCSPTIFWRSHYRAFLLVPCSWTLTRARSMTRVHSTDMDTPRTRTRSRTRSWTRSRTRTRSRT